MLRYALVILAAVASLSAAEDSAVLNYRVVRSVSCRSGAHAGPTS